MRRAGIMIIVLVLTACASDSAESPDAQAGTATTSTTSTTSTTAPAATTTIPATTAPTTTSTTSTTTTAPPSTAAPTTTLPDDPAGGTAFSCTPTDDEPSSFWSGPVWEDGETRELEMTTSQRGDGASPTATIQRGTLAFERYTDDGLLFTWTTDTSLIDQLGVSPAEAAQAGELFGALPDVPPVRYEMDNLLSFGSVLNVEEIRDFYDRTIDVFIEFAGDDELDGIVRAASALEQLDDETLALRELEELLTYHIHEGYDLTVGETLDFDDLLPNALGGEPFPAISTIELTDIVDADGCVRFVQTTTPDPEAFLRILEETVVGLFGDDGVDVGEIDQLDFSVQNEIISQFDYRTGRLWRVTAEQRIADGASEVVERLELTDVTVDRDG